MKILVWIVIIVGFFTACNPTEHGGLPPVASYKVTPESGKTTDTFRFDASLTNPGNLGDKVYFRWDWNHDGIWDDEYSKLVITLHRFYKVGLYQPILGVISSDGMQDTISLHITIQQGYSPPHPEFSVSPENGNVKVNYVFDASATNDDEDSIGLLRFIWDFDGNGIWDTPLSTNTTVNHIYPDTGRFRPILQVIDPQNMSAKNRQSIWVTDINDRLVADFSWLPEYGTTDSLFTLDATPSHHLDQPQAVLRYSWKLPPFYNWTEWSFNPTRQISFKREDNYDLELRIRDTGGLVNFCKKVITVYHQNLPPNPKFIIGCRRGNIRTQFFFNSWGTLDHESLPSSLEVRWDFDGDHLWDTEFSKEKTIYHNYPLAGTYKVYLEARDPDGLSDTTAQFIEVSPWNNETGLIYDQRDGQYYGTVKIGDQWWMSQNLNFAPYDLNKDEVRKLCYASQETGPINICNIMGGLYNCYHATREDWYGEVKGICPTGFHIPSRKEWEQLVSFIGGWDQADKLLPGGNTDFNALYAGFGETKQQGYGTVTVCTWINYGTYFWSFKKMSNPYAPNSWNITLIKGQQKIYPGYSDMKYYYSVRCLKNEE